MGKENTIKEKNVNEVLVDDHKRIDHLFESLVIGIQDNKALEEQQSLFHIFKMGLLRHLHWEEGVLFPVFDELSGLVSSPTRVLRAQHTELESMISDIEADMASGFDLDYLQVLAQYLAIHNENEETLLYPAIEKINDAGFQDRVSLDIKKGFK